MKKHLKTNYKIGGMALLTLLLTLVFPTACHASLQSRPGVSSLESSTASDFFYKCRQMETEAGSLGLSATIEVQGDKVVETSESNGIDVHMIKNTEYGTAAMLAASAYGNCPKGESVGVKDSTTQNASGIMQMAAGKCEVVAGMYSGASTTSSATKYIANADAKYKNVYNSDSMSNTSYIPGDATYETQKWRDAISVGWVSSNDPLFRRSHYGVFAFYNPYGLSYSSDGSRAAVVCGAGL